MAKRRPTTTMKSVFLSLVASCLLHCRYADRTNILGVSVSVWITYQDYSAQMKVEPNLDFNTIGPLDYPSSWQYVLVLSFKVTLHRSTAKKMFPILSSG